MKLFEFIKKIFGKELDLMSIIAATDKIFKTDVIVYYTLNVFDHSSGPLQSKIITSYQFKDKLANEQLLK